MKKVIIILLLALAATGAFAESELVFSSGNSFCDILTNESGTTCLWANNWPWNLGTISVSYMHAFSEKPDFLIGADLGVGPWSEYISANAAYQKQVFTVGNFDVALRGTAKLGVYILFDPYPLFYTDLDLLASRPGKSFFFGAGLSNSVSFMWNKEIDAATSSSCTMTRPCIKFTAGWSL